MPPLWQLAIPILVIAIILVFYALWRFPPSDG